MLGKYEVRRYDDAVSERVDALGIAALADVAMALIVVAAYHYGELHTGAVCTVTARTP